MSAVFPVSPRRDAVDYDPFSTGELARVVPTTESQREVWLADRLGREASLAFNESVELRLGGSLDAAALQAALQRLVERHDALRANFGPDGETMCVSAGTRLLMERADLSALAPAGRDQALAEQRRSAVDTPFDLGRGSLFRPSLLRLAEKDHLLSLTAHHIVCDGWSWWVLVRELGVLYAEAVGADGGGALAPVEAFADYALAEATRGAHAEFAADETYWISRFSDSVPVLDLPVDRARPARRGFASAREDHLIDAALVEALRATGGRRGASLFATLLTGFAGLLSRLSSGQDVVIGIPAAGQSGGGYENVVGHCVNLLPLRCNVDPARSFAHGVDATQEVLLDALEHQRYTFGSLLKKLQITRDPSRLPLVSVMFNIDQALDNENSAFPGLSMDFASNPRSYENFELFINAVQTHSGLRLECQYNTDLFDARTVRRWLAAYETLLRAASRRPETPCAELPLVDPGERASLLALQPPPTMFDRELGMHEHFEAQCDRAPERIAVICDGQACSYADLESRANRIAHVLRGNGAHSGVLVGLAVDRSPDMLAALLGILKTGAAYVPLDPGFPPERLAYMAGDAGLAALVTQRRHAARFDLRGRPVLLLDEIEDQLAAAPAERPPRDLTMADQDQVAYVIYTSGSTGRPKGVRVPHRAIANFLAGMRLEPGMTADDCLLAVTTLSFDIAVLELMLPLSVGARVVIAGRDTALDGGALADLLEREGATVMQATPATWRLLLDGGWAGKERFTALCGGEPLIPELAARLLPRCDRLWNLYGPTETTIWSTCARVEATPSGGAPDIDIGRPIANTTVWILDDNLQLCPRGVPGEICIGGEGVALGYLDRNGLTAERFIPDRYSSRPDARLYRTGDRGRWKHDGKLEHMGRLDHQVKLRGYRIELGEIESNLANHPDVSRVVATVREDRPGDARLIAYLVAAQAGQDIDQAAVLTHLRKALPEYMIPQHIVVLEAMPLLPNGKIDRNGLPAPDHVPGSKGAPRLAPRNPVEQRIALAMSEVLGVDSVGVEDDFFAMGGHSLLAARLTTRLNRDLDASLSLRTLFDHPTVARLAELVGGSADVGSSSRPGIERRGDRTSAPLSLMQERLYLLEQFNPGHATYNTPSAHRLIGTLDASILDRSLRDLAQRQTILRTRIEDEQGVLRQVVVDDIQTGLLQVQDLSYLSGTDREHELQKRLRALVDEPFKDFGQAPLFRARLFRLDDDEHVLFFMPHHIVWDGWSFDLMYAELAEIYAARIEGREPALPELPIDYGDFSAWHREWARGAEYSRQLEFWRDRLGSDRSRDDGPRAMPTDKPRRQGMSGRSESHGVTVPATLVDRLRATSRELDTTLFVTLLTAYFALLGRVTGQRDMIVATPVHGRNWAEVQGLMGYFTNLLPLRVRLEPEMPFNAAIKVVKETVLESFANPDIRLEDLTRELKFRSDGGGAVLYQSLFSFQDARERAVRWGNLRHQRVEVFQPGATEDLGLWFLDDNHGLTGGLIYNAEILHDSTALLLRERYLGIVERIADDPARSLADLTQFNDGHSDVIGGSTAVPIQALTAGGGPVADPGLVDGHVSGIDSSIHDRRVAYLRELWATMLEEEVGSEDNFFDLGGNSMLAVQMSNRVARDTGARIKLMPLATQTLAQIALELPDPEPGSSHASWGSRALQRVKLLFRPGAGIEQ